MAKRYRDQSLDDGRMPMWDWFGLTYSAYLVIPRSLLVGMPTEWQERMVALLEEMREVYDSDKIEDTYMVQLRRNGRFVRDPLRDYRHNPELPYREGNENGQ